MTAAIRKYVFAGSDKNVSAPPVFIIICVYAVLNSVYAGLFFGMQAMIMRSGISLTIIIAYIIIERSPLSGAATSFLSPTIIIGLIIFGSVYFGGDFLIFTYSSGVAMISLTYLNPRGLATYISLSSLMFATMLFGFQTNLLGPAFTTVYNILYFLVSVALNMLLYFFCKTYVQTLQALTEAENSAILASKAKGDFLANMSHEIRTPLNAIIGLTETELRRELPESNVENLRKIHMSGSVLIRIINNILDMSKIESGKFELALSEYDIVDLIYDIVTLNMVRIGSKPIDFFVSVDENIPRRLRGDDLRIKQLLTNLLNNAFKYTHAGSVELWVTCKPIAAGVLLKFEVADTGMGIHKDDLKMLFSEYSQVNQQSTRGVEGTGLGLAITKGLVELMGGKISALSEYGKGTAFTVQILQEVIDSTPVGPETAAALKDFSYTPEHTGTNVEYTPMPHIRVLVVDDVEINLDVAAACLEPYEIRVDCVDNGAEAVRRITADEPRYDLILMDHMMPEMDGIEAARAIRAIGTRYAASVPIIALTANVLAGSEDLFARNGFQGFLSKPIDLLKLDAALRKWVG